MGKQKRFLEFYDQWKTSWNAQDTIQKLRNKAKTGASSTMHYMNHQKLRFGVSLAVVGVLATASFFGNQYVKANTNVIYHVIYNGKEIGVVDRPDVVEQWLISQYRAAEKHYPNASISLNPDLKYQSEKVYKGNIDNTAALHKLSALLNIRAEAVAVIVDGQTIGYVQDRDTAQKILNKIKQTYIPDISADQSKKNAVRIAAKVKPEVTLKEVGFVQNVEVKNVTVEPGQVMEASDVEKLLAQGTVKQEQYTVKEGDTLSGIAQKYQISVDDIYRNNPDLKGELLQIGQVLNVTALEPKLTVKTVEVTSQTVEIPFAVKVKTDASMVQGTRKIMSAGSPGLKSVTYEISKANGGILSKEMLSEEVIKEPVEQVVVKGTKIVPSRGSGIFSWPVIGGQITSRFGYRWGRLHAGLDISSSNHNILAADNGRVVYAGWEDGYGNTILIDHGNGYQTRYGHLNKILVQLGQKVEKGQKIGIMGNTGRSFGTHLHFEVIKNGAPGNPLSYLN